MKNVIAILLTLFVTEMCHSADGTLDPSFGSGAGYVDMPAGLSANKVAVQADGKILVIGDGSNTNQLVRYHSDGTLDSSFGIGGIVDAALDEFFSSVIIQADGKILVVGNNINLQFNVKRYLENGSLDLSFGIGGVVTGPDGGANAVALQADSKIVAAGFFNGIFRVVRYDSNGSLDIIFASGPGQFASSIVIQPDGKAVVAGPSDTNNFQVVRYNIDGSFDSTFGIGGIATGPIGQLQGVLLQSDGKIVAVGDDAPNSPSSFQLVRFTDLGVLDGSYGTGGSAIGFVNSIASDAVMQSDGKVVVVGYDFAPFLFKLARFTTTGTPDLSFGTGGVVTGPAGFAFGTALQGDGKIVVVGTNDDAFTAFQVARYIGGPDLVPTTITFPFTGAKFTKGATVSFRGAAQGQSMVYLFIDGVLVAGTATDPVTNTWEILQEVNRKRGNHTATAVAIYDNGNVDILSDPVVFTIKDCCLP